MSEKQLEYLEQTTHLFMRFGIKSMTMDDIARQLGISKKTLYGFVSDKTDLVEKAMQLIVEREKCATDQLIEDHSNAIDMLFEMSKEVAQKFGQIHPSIHYDLQKYYPSAWRIFYGFKTDYIADWLEKNLIEGIQQGLYRSNLDPFVIARLYAIKIDLIIDTDTFPADKYNPSSIHLEMMRYHIRGIASEAGLDYLKQKVKQEKIQL